MKFVFLFSLILIYGCKDKSVQNDQIDSTSIKIDTTTYFISGFNYGNYLHLASDNQFIQHEYIFGCMGGGKRVKTFGSFQLDSTKLRLSPKRIKYLNYLEYFDGEIEVTELPYGIDSLAIKTDYDIIKWHNQKYLLSNKMDTLWNGMITNDYLSFIDSYNQGVGINGIYGVFKLRNRSNIEPVQEFESSQIPKKWRKFLLSEPIKAKILSIEKLPGVDHHENRFLIKIDKGNKDGVHARLQFISADFQINFKPTSIDYNKSHGVVDIYDFNPDLYKPGLELRTSWDER